VAAPIRGGDLILDQGVNCIGIGDTQQRFGQTHQRDAFGCGQAIFGQKDLHQTGIGLSANLSNQIGGLSGDFSAVIRR
jgi:hypothetical protein